MPVSRFFAVAGASALAAGLAVAAPAGAAAAKYTVQTLHFAVHVGPGDKTACDVVGDLYTPARASAKHRVPAILTTNGFGGSKDDQAGLGKAFSSKGYEVLSYSGLGFGASASEQGTGCKIELDDPTWDGRAASQLVSYLGGAKGIAFTDAAHAHAAPRLTVVVHDKRDHDGHKRKDDPRVGMIGGSYGGEVQFAAAADDPRVDTIVPLITWNDLSYSLDPNNTAQTKGVSTSTPGATKIVWGLLFSAEGVGDGLEGAPADPSRDVGCPNFADFVCPALVTAGSTGYFASGDIASLRHASVATYLKKIKVPTLLMQGENDTLFNLNEAAATYRALKAQHTHVQMIWQSWGHSHLAPAPGEFDESNPDTKTQYETARVADWFAHYLKGSKVSTGPAFSYFRDWISYSGIATPAYKSSATFPVGSAKTYHLSGTGTLAPTTAATTAGSQTLTTPPAGPPTSLNTVDVASGYTVSAIGDGTTDAPGTAATWTSAPLAKHLDVVGSPVVKVSLSAPVAAGAQSSGPAGQLVLFVKVEDVNGSTASMVHGLEAPIRVPDVGKRITVTLPAIVHKFAAGHQVRLVIAGGSDNYRGGLTPNPVTIDSGAGQTLTLPAVS